MGQVKNKKPLSIKDKIKITIFVIIILGFVGFLLNSINKENASRILKEANYIHPDTLIISKDLKYEANIILFIEKEYPKYKI